MSASVQDSNSTSALDNTIVEIQSSDESGNGALVTSGKALHINLRNNAGTEIGTATNPVRVDPTGTTAQPVTQSGTWTVQQGTPPWSVSQSGTWTTGRTWTLASGTDSVSVVQSTSPWVENISQFGGSAVVTGTGASGSGIPRVTVSNDSNILSTQSGTWTVQPGNTANTTPWLTTDTADGPVTPGTAATKSQLIGGQFNTALPTLTNTQQSAIQLDSSGRLIISPLASTSTVTANQGTANTASNAWPIKITDGTDTALVTTNSDLKVSDGLRNGGVYGALTLTTGNTAYEAKVGGSRLSNRKSLTITALDDMYWGYNNGVTTSNGTPLYKNQSISFAVDPDSTFQVWVVASANSKTARITEST